MNDVIIDEDSRKNKITQGLLESGYGYECYMHIQEVKKMWSEGILTIEQFSDLISESIRYDDGIPF